jgi:hypothetical protein
MAKKDMESKSESKDEAKKDIAQDKAMIKKAFKEHDSQEHPGKHTKITLKKGGMPMKKMAKGGVTGTAMKAMGRNMARVANQKSSSRGK